MMAADVERPQLIKQRLQDQMRKKGAKAGIYTAKIRCRPPVWLYIV